MKILKIVFLVFLLQSYNFSDRIAYKGIIKIEDTSGILKVIHYHNWDNYEKLFKIYKSKGLDDGIFSNQNDFSYIHGLNMKTGKTIFKIPSPALTYIKISEDAKYILGLSYIHNNNPFQFVLLDNRGEILISKYMSPEESKLNSSEFEVFKKKFSLQYKYFKSTGAIIKYGKHFYVDFLKPGLPGKLGKAWEFLYNRLNQSHYSKNFSRTSSNFLFFYYGSFFFDKTQKGKDPKVRFIHKGNELEAISLLDPKGKRFKIPIKENVIE